MTTKAGEQPTITQALKPCPFCGGEVYTERHTEWFNSGTEFRGYSVTCDKCNMRFGTDNQLKGSHKDHTEGDFASDDAAIAAWNTRTTSLAAQLDKQAVADAVDEAETSLLVWTDAAWNGQIAGDARDFCRAQYGRFKQLRETLGLPEYKRPEFQERDLSIVQASLAAQDGLVEAVTRFMPTNINLANKNVDDREILPLDVTFGELRAIDAALSAIKGDKS